MSTNISSRRRFAALAQRQLRAGATKAAELGLLGVRVSEVDPPYVTTADGRRLINYASCCYLETATRPAIIAASQKAAAAYGTQLSLSPTYMALDLYDHLTAELERICSRPVAVASTTTLGHFGTIPALITGDAICVVDRQAHNSLQMATRLLVASGVELTHVAHNDLDALASIAAENPDRAVWYVCDGVYSMFGDTAPYAELRALADRLPNLWVYMDDAHGTGWSGKDGRGEALDWFWDHPRTVVALSLNKSWGTGGGAITFPTEEMRAEAVMSPSPFVFSGPLKPSELAAGVASAAYHQSEGRAGDVERLHRLIRHVITEADRLGLDLVDRTPTPIFFVKVGETDAATGAAARLVAEGKYVNASAFPVVPRGQAGVRFTVTTALTEELITDLLARLAEVVSETTATRDAA